MLYEKFLPTAMTFDNHFSFYGEIFKISNIDEDINTKIKYVPTMSCHTTKNGFNMIYNKEFVDKLSETELTFVVIHEESHFFTNTNERGKCKNKEVFNIASDMCINYNINKHIPKEFATIPKQEVIIGEDGNIINEEDLPTYTGKYKKEVVNTGQFIPKEYVGEIIAEDVYDWLLNTDPNTGEDKNNKNKMNTNGQKISSGYGENGMNGEKTMGTKEILEHCQKMKDFEDMMLKLDEHLEDEVSQEMKDVMVKELIDRARMRGTISAEEEAMIKGLRKSKKDYLREIKRSISHAIGTEKHSTWVRPNRKDIPLPGYKKRMSVMNLILDTSGSMGGNFEKILSYVFHQGYVFNLFQIDTEVKSVENIKDRKQFNKLKIKGLGGTCLQPAIDKIAIDDKLKSLPIVVLTDGATDSLDFSKTKGRVVIISCGSECPITKKGGQLKQIVIANEGE